MLGYFYCIQSGYFLIKVQNTTTFLFKSREETERSESYKHHNTVCNMLGREGKGT